MLFLRLRESGKVAKSFAAGNAISARARPTPEVNINRSDVADTNQASEDMHTRVHVLQAYREQRQG